MTGYRISDRNDGASQPIGNCIQCGKPIEGSHIPTEERMRKYVLKWKVHPHCYEFINSKLDLETR